VRTDAVGIANKQMKLGYHVGEAEKVYACPTTVVGQGEVKSRASRGVAGGPQAVAM
jgi:hypothetical protein